MSITDELREWAKQHKGWNLFDMQLNAIADRIDEVVASEYVKLPVDADGVPIRVGDHVEETDMSIIGRAQGEVNRIVFGKHGTSVRIETELGYADRSSQSLRHISKPPTVEDVLRYMNGELYEAARARWASECTIGEYNERVKAILSEYANKLREAVKHEHH